MSRGVCGSLMAYVPRVELRLECLTPGESEDGPHGGILHGLQRVVWCKVFVILMVPLACSGRVSIKNIHSLQSYIHYVHRVGRFYEEK